MQIITAKDSGGGDSILRQIRADCFINIYSLLLSVRVEKQIMALTREGGRNNSVKRSA
jgi:hypothetical protein